MLIICTSKSVKRAYRYTDTHAHTYTGRHAQERILICQNLALLAHFIRIYRLFLGSTNLLTVPVVVYLSMQSIYLSLTTQGMYLLSYYPHSTRVSCAINCVCLRLFISSSTNRDRHTKTLESQTTEVSKMLVSYPIRVVSPPAHLYSKLTLY